MKIEWLITNATTARSSIRTDSVIFQVCLYIYTASLAAFAVSEPLCDMKTPSSWAVKSLCTLCHLMKIELLIAKVPAFGSPARGESDCLAIFEAREPVCVLMKIEWLVTAVT